MTRKRQPSLELIHGTGDDADDIITPADEADADAYATQIYTWLMAAWERDGEQIGLSLLEHLPEGGVRLDEMQLLIKFEIAVTALRGIATNAVLEGEPEDDPTWQHAFLYRNLAAIALSKVLPRERTLKVVDHD